jgi:hypothetical protein
MPPSVPFTGAGIEGARLDMFAVLGCFAAVLVGGGHGVPSRRSCGSRASTISKYLFSWYSAIWRAAGGVSSACCVIPAMFASLHARQRNLPLYVRIPVHKLQARRREGAGTKFAAYGQCTHACAPGTGVISCVTSSAARESIHRSHST